MEKEKKYQVTLKTNVSSTGYTDDQIHETKNYFLLFFLPLPQMSFTKLFQKKPKIPIQLLLKNPKNLADK